MLIDIKIEFTLNIHIQESIGPHYLVTVTKYANSVSTSPSCGLIILDDVNGLCVRHKDYKSIMLLL